MKRIIILLLVILLPVFTLFLPLESFGIQGLTIIQQRIIALFFLAAILWITELIPIYATSVLIIVLELVFLSDSGLRWFIQDSGTGHFGDLLPYRSIMGTFASPIILLFLGGFFLSIASTKYRLDQNLARILLKPFGNKPSSIIFGLMIITALFSMFMSNTATTAMMLSIIAPVMVYFDQTDPGRTALALCIPLAANIGGIGTPIGTPPNALAMKYLLGDDQISFSEWMAFGVPYVIVLLGISGWLLLKLFKPQKPTLDINITGKFSKSPKAYIVYFTFAFTVLLWLSDFIHGMNAYTVALLPVAIFLATGVINKEDLKKLNWDVLWLVSGGIALGLALGGSGLATNVVASIPFASFSPYLIILLTVALGALMANFMSNTATANLLLPIIATIGGTLLTLEALGGAKMLIIALTLSTSMGMALPISTPPNALAHATGVIQTREMLKVGVITGLLGIGLIFITLYLMKTINFF